MLEDRRVFPEEEGNLIREYKAMQHRNFLSSWLREDAEGNAEKMEEMRKKNKEEEVKRGKS